MTPDGSVSWRRWFPIVGAKEQDMRRCCWALLLSLALVFPASAQETRGNISGTVRDAQGVVPGATVTITSTRHGASQQLVTNSSGYFEAPLLQPGNYQVTVEMTGFKTLTRTGIVLAVGQQVSLPLTLEVGQVTEETVTVTADTPLLDTSSVSSGAELRQPHGRRPADVLEHADHADALRGRREPVHQPEPGVAGLRRRHDAGGRARRSAASAATPTRSTAPPTAAAAAASRRRRTPT